MPKHFLITGGAGFIGSHLADKLIDLGHTVTAIDDLSTGRLANISHLRDTPSFQLVIESITEAGVMDRLCSMSDVIVHLAAAVGVQLVVNDPVRTIETNILGTHTVLKMAARYQKKVLLISSSEVYGKGVNVPFSEDDDRLLGPTTRSRWSYADTKAIDEYLGQAYHKTHGLPVIVARLFNTVGPRQTGQYGMVIPRFVQQALQGDALTVYGEGTQTRCFCSVHDTVRALIALSAAESAVGEVFNVGSTEEITILDLAKQILVQTGGDPSRLRLIPYEQAYEPGFEDMLRRIPDIRKIKRIVGWNPTIPLADMLEEIIRHTKSQQV
ncbi:MAG: GDP-mannose 4,6-dehydratase [Anaerolineae bacterium]|nr:GDP-mannose 4,6-dehydratase [Anaerolineae bacterium]